MAMHHFATLLPILEGPFSVELEPGDAPALRYRGLQRTGNGYWEPFETKELDEALTLELPDDDPRLGAVLRAWAGVLREAFVEQAQRKEPSFAARDVLDLKTVKELVAAELSDAELTQRWRWRLAAALPPSAELVAAHAALAAWFEDRRPTPFGEGTRDDLCVRLEFVSSELRDGHVWLVLRLVVWEVDEAGNQSIRDVKEQEVVFLSAGPGLEPLARVTNFLTAYSETLSQLLTRSDPETLMPHDLVLSPQHYKRGETVDDFRKLLARKFKT